MVPVACTSSDGKTKCQTIQSRFFKALESLLCKRMTRNEAQVMHPIILHLYPGIREMGAACSQLKNKTEIAAHHVILSA